MLGNSANFLLCCFITLFFIGAVRGAEFLPLRLLSSIKLIDIDLLYPISYYKVQVQSFVHVGILNAKFCVSLNEVL